MRVVDDASQSLLCLIRWGVFLIFKWEIFV